VATPRTGLGLRVLNFSILATAYLVVLLSAAGGSRPYLLATIFGGVAVAAVAAISFVRGPREAVEQLTRGIPVWLMMLGAVLPWAAVLVVVARRGLWWTQRPSGLRFFALYLLVTWTIGLCSSWHGAGRRMSSAQRAVAMVASIVGVIGLQGAAFGVNRFGCAVSALMLVLAAFAWAVATVGTTSAHLKLFAGAVAASIALAASEATVRLLKVGQNVQEVNSREFARQFYSLTPPGSVFVNEPKALDEFGPALVEINSLGIRGPEIADKRADWLLIGDSMIEARQLPWTETVTARLQETLRARSIPLRVIGHGMRGWSPLLEWNWYLKVGREFQPRTVLLFFFWNDLWTVGDEVSTFRAALGRDGRPDRFDIAVDSDWIWYKHSRMMRLSEEVWTQLNVSQLRRAFSTMTGRSRSKSALDAAAADQLARGLSDPPLTDGQLQAVLTRPEGELDPELQSVSRGSFWPSIRPWPLWTEKQRAAAARTEQELQRFGEDVRAGGAQFVVVFVPNPLQVGAQECSVGRLFDRVAPGVILPPESGIQTWLKTIADRHGFIVLDPSERMRAAVQADSTEGPAAPFYLRADCHWSARGHQFIADYLVDWYARGKAGGS
jgi:hypothetical protein